MLNGQNVYILIPFFSLPNTDSNIYYICSSIILHCYFYCYTVSPNFSRRFYSAWFFSIKAVRKVTLITLWSGWLTWNLVMNINFQYETLKSTWIEKNNNVVLTRLDLILDHTVVYWTKHFFLLYIKIQYNSLLVKARYLIPSPRTSQFQSIF